MDDLYERKNRVLKLDPEKGVVEATKGHPISSEKEQIS